MKIVIVGGVAAGASAAARLRRLDESAEIVLLEKGEHISYANCGLPYFIGGVIQKESALTLQTPQSFSSRFNIDVRTRHEAVSLRPSEKSLTVRDHDAGRDYVIEYDALLLAPGAKPIVPGFAATDDPRVFTVRNIPDTKRVHAFIKTAKPGKAVIVGGGFIGVEMAENLVHNGVEVVLVEMQRQVLAPFDPEMAHILHEEMRRNGVTLMLGKGVSAMTPHDGGMRVDVAGETVEADFVVVAAGVTPDTIIAKAAGLSVNAKGAIRVDRRMRTSDPHIYAAGDAVETTHAVTGAHAQAPLASPANRQGRIVADVIHGDTGAAYSGLQGSLVIKAFDLTAAATGLNEKEIRASGIEYEKAYTTSQSHASYYPGATSMQMKLLFARKDGRILGAQVVGQKGVDKRCDILASAVRLGLKASQLTEFELCYAPPFSSAKDPVNMLGYVAENILSGKVSQRHWEQPLAPAEKGMAQLVDVRTQREYDAGHIAGAVHIPLDELRQRLNELPGGKTLYVHCQSGLRSYLACRILAQNGWNCHNMAGGYNVYVLQAATPEGTAW